jgi:phage protein D
MPNDSSTKNLIIGVPGALRAELVTRLVSAVVEDSTNLPATATLRFRDDDHTFLGQSRITVGTKLVAKVRLGESARPAPLFTGEVVTLEAEFDGEGTFTTVRAFDLSHRLMRGQRVRSFTDRRASEIARQLAVAAKLPIGKIDRTAILYETVTQPNTNDWDFLKMLAVDNDAEVAVVDGKFFFRNPVRAASAPGGATAAQSPLVVQMNKNVLAIRSTVTAVGQVDSVVARGWDIRRKVAVKSTAKTTASDEIQIRTTSAKLTRPFGAAQLTVADVPYQTVAETRAVAGAVAADVTGARAELEVGILGNPHLRAGVPLSMQDIGEPFDGKYTTTSSRHTFAVGERYETWLTVSGRQDRSAWGLAGGAAAPARQARVQGLAVGIVTDTKAHLDKRHPERRNQGWVRLRFPWLTDRQDYQSDWVRTVQLGGVGGGGVFCPAVDDEVLVGFDQGLLDRPYVIGGLYNGKDKPSRHSGELIDPTSGKVNRRSLASRTGDRIEFLESPGPTGPRGIRLATTKDKLTVHLDERKTAVVVHSDGTIEIDARRAVTVKGRGITLDAGVGDLTLKGRTVLVAGTVEATVRAPFVRLN